MSSVSLITHTTSILGLAELDLQEVAFIQALLSGLPAVMAARTAGVPAGQARSFAAQPHVASVLAYLREELITSQVEIDRNMLNLMLLESHAKAGSATEEIMAIRELGKMNGLYAPTQVEHTHDTAPKTEEQLKRLSTKELANLAGGEVYDAEWEEVDAPE